MNILKRQNWWIWLIITLFSQGTGFIVLGALLDVFDKNAWYAKWKYWVIAFAALILPGLIMLYIFVIQIMVSVAEKLEVPGKELYLSPYVWILCLIIPIIGWVCLFVMLFYIQIWHLVMLYRGYGEKYIK